MSLTDACGCRSTASSTAAPSPTGRRTLPPRQQTSPLRPSTAPKLGDSLPVAGAGSGKPRKVSDKTRRSPQPLKTSSPSISPRQQDYDGPSATYSPRPSTQRNLHDMTSDQSEPPSLLSELRKAQKTAESLAAERTSEAGAAAPARRLAPEPAPAPRVPAQEEGPPAPPWNARNVTAAPKVKVLRWMQERASPTWLKKNRLVSGTRTPEEIAASLRNADITAAYRDLLESGAFATAAEKRKASQKAAVRAGKKKEEEAAMLKRAKEKAEKRHQVLLEQQAAAAKARGVVVGAKVKLGKTRTGWHDVNSDGTSMNVGNKLSDKPSVTLHSHYNAGSAMMAALSED